MFLGTKLPHNAVDMGDGTLIITDVRAGDAGTYTCVGSNIHNIATDSAVLNVQGKYQKKITAQFCNTHT